jgi:hypothetical protein
LPLSQLVNKKSSISGQAQIETFQPKNRYNRRFDQLSTPIINHLSKAKIEGHVDLYWTNDGRLFFKRLSDDNKMLIKNLNDL